MKERPILFHAEMIRAILDGSKTQTRRVVKDKYYTRFQIDKGVPHNEPDTILVDIDTKTPIPYLKVSYDECADRIGGRIRSPYGKVGDRLWCKQSRITLEITRIRVERLQDITGEGARAEGIKEDYDPWSIFAFAHFWDFLNLKRGYGWETNPFVWVIEFKKIK